MKKTIIPAILAIAALAMFTGCEKETEQYAHEPGTDIIFGASTTWNNDIETRTEYSGKDQNDNNISSSSTFERIDWVADKDRIRILCDAATGKVTASKKIADYVIYNVRKGSDKKKSEADITSCDNNSLQWGTGTHVFYALYPAAGTESNYGFTSNNPATTADIESVSGTKAKITGTIPATQEAKLSGNIYKPNMNYAYMFATTKVSANSSGNVLLSFDPLVTSLEFSLTSDSTDPVSGNLTRVELSSTSTALTGSFSATIDGNGSTPSVSVTASAYSASTNKITITLPDGGKALTDTPVKVTFLTLPVEQKDLTITLYFGSEFSKKRTLKLNTADGPVKVAARKKAYFNFGVPNLVYTLDLIAPTGIVSSTGGSKTYQVKSLKTAGSNPSVGVGWTAEFMEVGKSTTWSSTKPAWLDVFTSADDAGSVTFKPYTATLLENTDLTNAEPKKWTGSKVAEAGNDADHPINLALRNIYGQWTGTNGAVVSSIAQAKLNTANCYVISAPGWYCFPAIYGNAYKNDDNNPSSYTSTATAPSPYGALQHFVNHLDHAITQGWIQNNDGMADAFLNHLNERVKAKLLWQDKQNLIRESNVTMFLEAPDAPNSHSIDGSYVKFYIAPEDIFQGNAVLAVTLDDVIVWSWHIWVIEQDKLQTKKVYPGSTSVVSSVDMMEWNLGWYDSDYVTYPRSVKVKITQAESGKTKEFEIVQDQPQLHGGNVFFNWGRKDPMLGMNADFSARSQYGPDQTKWKIVDLRGTSTTASIGTAIQNPYVFYSTPGGGALAHPQSGHWSDPRYENLWNTTATVGYNVDVAVTKTIYDPCPPGFKVPNRNVYARFTPENIVGNWSQGWYYSTGSGSETIFFPATFLRDFDSGNLDDWRRYGATIGENTYEGYIGGYYWAAATLHVNDPTYWGGVYLEFRDHANFSPEPVSIPAYELGPVGYGFTVRAVKE